MTNDYKDYFLVSAYNKKENVSTVYLYSLEERKIIHEWIPPIEEIQKRKKNKYPVINRADFRTQHPFPTKDGGIIFSSGEGPLVKTDLCSNVEWVIDRHFHHSIEKNSRGNFLVPIVINSNENYFSRIYGDDTQIIIRDDGFAEISPSGVIVNESSITKILIENNYGNLLLLPLIKTEELIHLNDADPINKSDQYVKEGDVMLSMRHISTVALYRPSTNKIIWLKYGPWSLQHDIDYQGNGIFTIFGNDSYNAGPIRGYSTIYKYDMKNDEVSEYLPLKKAKIFTHTQGLHSILSNKDIFIEETDKGMIHVLDSNGLTKLRYVRSIDEGRIGAIHWSRYLEESNDFVSKVKRDKSKCNKKYNN